MAVRRIGYASKSTPDYPPWAVKIEVWRAETGTVSGGRTAVPVDKPVNGPGYPRRNRFAPCAETGSVIRRIEYGRPQNRVRPVAESGSEEARLRRGINQLGRPYTVYE